MEGNLNQEGVKYTKDKKLHFLLLFGLFIILILSIIIFYYVNNVIFKTSYDSVVYINKSATCNEQNIKDTNLKQCFEEYKISEPVDTKDWGDYVYRSFYYFKYPSDIFTSTTSLERQPPHDIKLIHKKFPFLRISFNQTFFDINNASFSFTALNSYRYAYENYSDRWWVDDYGKEVLQCKPNPIGYTYEGAPIYRITGGDVGGHHIKYLILLEPPEELKSDPKIPRYELGKSILVVDTGYDANMKEMTEENIEEFIRIVETILRTIKYAETSRG